MANNKTTTPREITFRVRRYDPDKDTAPHWDEYKMHVHDGMTVLEALHELKALYGDAFVMTGMAKGGNDTLTGGNAYDNSSVTNILSGDGNELRNSAMAGDDVIIGGDNFGDGTVINEMYGDAIVADATAKVGDDVLIGGSSSGGRVFNIVSGDARDMFDSRNNFV